MCNLILITNTQTSFAQTHIFNGQKVPLSNFNRVPIGMLHLLHQSSWVKPLEQILVPPDLSLPKKLTEKTCTQPSIILIRDPSEVNGYKFYLVPSRLFNLAVDHIPKTIINKLQTKATSHLKRWLKMPRCATLASLFHPEVE